jgi:hypothetical protein
MPIEKPFAVAPHPLGTVTSGNELENRPASHLGEFKHLNMRWMSSGSSSLYARGDFGSSKPVDFCALLSANAGGSTTIRLRLGSSQGAVDGSSPSYDSGALPFIDPSITREDGLYHSHLQMPSVVNARWWRIDIGSHSGSFEASILVLGKRMTAGKFYSPDFGFGVEDKGSLEWNRLGVPEDDVGVIHRRLDFTLGWISQTEFETQWRPLAEKIGETGMALWCFDPQANAYRQAKTYFGKLREPAYAQGGVKPLNMSQRFSIESII